MADQKISQLPELLELVGNEDLVVASNHKNYRIKAQNVGLGPAPTQESIGLGNVDNTSDADKPISAATQIALDGKSNVGHTHPINEVTDLQAALTGKAALAHNHSVMDVTGLSAILDEKADLFDLTAKSDLGHGHAITDIDGLSAELTSIHSQLSGLDVSPHIDGSPTVYVNETSLYTITDFDRFLTYDISTDNGAVLLTGNVISYTPDSPGVGHLYINGKTYSLPVTDKIITAPVITLPVNNMEELGPIITFVASAFETVPVSNDTHTATDWEVASDLNFTTLVYASYGNVLDLTDITVELAPAQTLFVRVRYRTDLRVSDWSNPIAFTTKVDYLPTSETALLSASDKEANTRFGIDMSLSADGSRLVIGTYTATVNGLVNAGKAYVFRRENLNWIEEAILIASDKAANSRFGGEVVMSEDGSQIVLSAYEATVNAETYAGKVYIFLRNGTIWTEDTIILPPVPETNATFGSSMALSSDGLRLFVGSPGASVGALNQAGKVYVFLKSGGIWTEEAILTASDKAAADWFGGGISIDTAGSRVVIGATNAMVGGFANAGKAYVFNRIGTSWTEEVILTASDASVDARFGRETAISADGSRLVVSSPDATVGGFTFVGKAYVFNRIGVSWSQEAILMASNRLEGDEFGWSINMSADGQRIVAGAPYSTVGATSTCGAVYLFVYSGVSWNETSIISKSLPEAWDEFGDATALSSDGFVLAVGASYDDPDGVLVAGSVTVYT